jgi:hypothetical protein
MPRASSWSYPKEHKLGFHGADSPRWALVGPLVSENRVLRLVRPGLAGTQDGRPRQLPERSLGPSPSNWVCRQSGVEKYGAGINAAQGVSEVVSCCHTFFFQKKDRLRVYLQSVWSVSGKLTDNVRWRSRCPGRRWLWGYPDSFLDTNNHVVLAGVR